MSAVQDEKVMSVADLKKVKSFIRTIEVPIYELDVIVVVTNHMSHVIDRFNLNVDKDGLDIVKAFTVDVENPLKLEIYMIFHKDHANINTVLHELTHLTSFLCKHRDIRHDVDNDESLAYFNGWVGSEVFEVIDKYHQRHQYNNSDFTTP